MVKDMFKPAEKGDLELCDTVILNGEVAMIDYEDKVHETSYVGVREYTQISTFGGFARKLASEFAFSPEMEEMIGWRDRAANVRMAFSDNPIDPHTVAEDAIMFYYGAVEREFRVNSSELSGYLWTDEEFKVGGHSLIDILKAHVGEHCHIEVELYRERNSL